MPISSPSRCLSSSTPLHLPALSLIHSRFSPMTQRSSPFLHPQYQIPTHIDDSGHVCNQRRRIRRQSKGPRLQFIWAAKLEIPCLVFKVLWFSSFSLPFVIKPSQVTFTFATGESVNKSTLWLGTWPHSQSICPPCSKHGMVSLCWEFSPDLQPTTPNPDFWLPSPQLWPSLA